MFIAPKLRSFVGTGIVKPKSLFVMFPPECIWVTNVVSKTTFNQPVNGAQIAAKHPYCRRNTRNWRAVPFRSLVPPGSSAVYEDGMMIITGCTSMRASRYVADLYADYIRSAGYPDLRITQFKIVNCSTTFAFRETLDIERYKREACPELVYVPDSFVGARKHRKITNASLALFNNKGTAVGTPDLHNMCFDAHDEICALRPFMVPRGSEEEKQVLARAKESRKRGKKTAVATKKRKSDKPPVVRVSKKRKL